MRWGVLLLLLVSGMAHAQEMKCPQVFMNASEKEVCANAQLLALDRAMGTAYRAAAPHMAKIERDHRAFKKDRKACKGDVACLTAAYEARINALLASVPAPVEPVQQAENVGLTPAYVEPSTPAVAEQPTIAPPPQPYVASQRPAQPPASDEGMGWGTWAILGLALFFLIAMIVSFVEWVALVVRRCPRCSTWWAEDVGQEHDTRHGHETITRTDEHRNRGGEITGTTSRREQVAYKEVVTLTTFRCNACQNEWVRRSTRRV